MAFQHIPDLIISDIMMPEMDGLQFCREIKKDVRTSHIPVILVTAKSTQLDRLNGLHEGADAYLVKPFDPDELNTRIEKLLQIRDQLRKHYQRYQMLPTEQIQENKFLDKVKIELENNLGNESYQMDDLVQSMHLSRTQLHRKLKALTGKTFVQLLTDMKMHRGKELLVKTDLTVAEISFQLGYRDDSYFGKVFKSTVGMAPGAYRMKGIKLD
jgi:YesN/AraC family two-component response regulator